jgi:hypothetical protein
MPTPTSQADFQNLVASVGEALPGNWDLKPYGEDNWACALFDLDSHLRLFFRPVEWKDATKIEIRGEIPKDSRGQEPYLPSVPTGHKMPSIKMAGSKSPEQIARDIERRLLPEVIPLVEEALARISQAETYYTKVTSVTQEIAQLLGVSVKPDAKTVSFYHSPYPPFAENIGSANIGSDEVELELHLTPDTSLAVLSMLKKRGG